MGEPEQLSSVEDTKARIDQALAQQFRQHEVTLRAESEKAQRALTELKKILVAKQHSEREALRQHQEARWTTEAKQRAARLRKGWKGLWDKVTGEAKQTRERNMLEALRASKRDTAQRDQLIWSHISERAAIDQQRKARQGHDIAQVQRLAQLLPEHARAAFGNVPKPSGPAMG